MQDQADIAGLMGRIKFEAQKVDQSMREDLVAIQPPVSSLLAEVLEYGLFNGGKRIRPLLAVAGYRLCGGDEPGMYKVGIAFEYLHTATLFHDDIIDRSNVRRGKESIFRKFGTEVAILAGDFLHAHSMAIVGNLTGAQGLSSFCRATKGMVDGEFMQLQNARNHNLSELDYYNAIMGKTGLLIASACEVGGLFGEGDEEEVEALKKYGENLGCAFQIVDDLLDYQGNAAKTGKAIGNDLAEGKMTLPLILAIENANLADKDRLLTIIASEDMRAASFNEVYELIDTYDGFLRAKKQAQEAVDIAIRELRIFSSEKGEDDKKMLENLAGYVLEREK